MKKTHCNQCDATTTSLGVTSWIRIDLGGYDTANKRVIYDLCSFKCAFLFLQKMELMLHPRRS